MASGRNLATSPSKCTDIFLNVIFELVTSSTFSTSIRSLKSLMYRILGSGLGVEDDEDLDCWVFYVVKLLFVLDDGLAGMLEHCFGFRAGIEKREVS